MPNAKPLEKPDRAVIDELRQSLTAKRGEMLKLYEHDVRVGQESTDDNADDFADRANNAYNRDLMFALSDGERHMLRWIDEALGRLENGKYGVCRNCGTTIGLPRLQAVPWARYCIDCQELEEKGLLEG